MTQSKKPTSKKFKLQIIFEVSQNWIEDGFNLNKERLSQIQNFFEEDLLPYARPGEETKAIIKVIKG